jgi:hypothetical protein
VLTHLTETRGIDIAKLPGGVLPESIRQAGRTHYASAGLMGLVMKIDKKTDRPEPIGVAIT